MQGLRPLASALRARRCLLRQMPQLHSLIRAAATGYARERARDVLLRARQVGEHLTGVVQRPQQVVSCHPGAKGAAGGRAPPPGPA